MLYIIWNLSRLFIFSLERALVSLSRPFSMYFLEIIEISSVERLSILYYTRFYRQKAEVLVT